MENKFQQEINKAFQAGLIDIIRELYLLKENNYIDENLNFSMKELDIELLERMIRDYCDWRFFLDNKLDTFNISIEIKDDKTKEFLDWFLQFFFYLEAMELAEKHKNHSNYKPTKEIKDLFKSPFSSYPIDVKGKRLVFNNININYI